MNHRLQEMLCCPSCGADLTMYPFEKDWTEIQGQVNTVVIKDGVLCCEHCRVWYPVMDYIPIMLTFSTPVHGKFAERHRQHMELLAGYTTPQGKPQPGERSVQQTFSEEWDLIQDNELSFIFAADDLVELNRQVWLKPLQKTRTEFKSVLNIGVGIGQETIALQKAVGNAEIVGVDLNFALLQRGRACRDIPDFHLVIASLFRLPFRRASFDLVYSQGVIHHTYSTKAAFKAICPFVAARGHLFIWVYSLDSHLIPKGFKGFILRTKRDAEKILRPLVSRAPRLVRDAIFMMLTTMLHPFIRHVVLHKTQWKRQNTDHGLRDWLSPRYAHRHSYNEVLEWFEESEFEIAGVQSPATYRRLFGKQQYGVGILGQRMAVEPLPTPQYETVRTAEAQTVTAV